MAAITSYQGAFAAGAVFAAVGFVGLRVSGSRRARGAQLAEEGAFVAEHPGP